VENARRAPAGPSPGFNDLDRLQFVNDLYGNLDGDIVIKRWPIFWIRIAAFGSRGRYWRRPRSHLDAGNRRRASQQMAEKLR